MFLMMGHHSSMPMQKFTSQDIKRNKLWWTSHGSKDGVRC